MKKLYKKINFKILSHSSSTLTCSTMSTSLSQTSTAVTSSRSALIPNTSSATPRRASSCAQTWRRAAWISPQLTGLCSTILLMILRSTSIEWDVPAEAPTQRAEPCSFCCLRRSPNCSILSWPRSRSTNTSFRLASSRISRSSLISLWSATNSSIATRLRPTALIST